MPARKYFYNEQTDQIVRDAYIRMRRHNDTTALRKAAARLGWPKHQIKERARELGVTQPRGPNWTAAEMNLLERLSWMSDIRLEKKMREAGFCRSANAVRQMKLKLAIGGEGNGEWYTVNHLAKAFGIDHHKVAGWIKRGMLRATVMSEDKHHSRILHRDVRQFVRKYPDEYDLAKVQKHWFVDMLGGTTGAHIRVKAEYVRICANCGAEIITKQFHKQYCDRKCFQAHRPVKSREALCA